MLAQCIEDDPWVPAPDVEDVRPDIERVVQPDRLLEQVRQRQERDQPVLHRRDDVVERLDRCRDVVVGEHHALRRARRAAREDELEHLVGFGPFPGGLARLPVGREERVVRGRLRRERLDRRRREVGEAGRSRVGRVTARTQDQVAGPRGADDGGDRVHRHPQVERHDHEAGVHRPEIGGRQLRARWAPGQDPIARLEVERPEPPGGDPRAAIEIAVRPVRARAIVRPQAKRWPIAETGHGALEQVDQGHRHERIPRAGRRMLRRRRRGMT